MLHLLDDALESWVQAELRSSLGGRDVEVSFDTPDREFDQGGRGPTVNLFLWDIMQSERSHAGRTVAASRDGGPVHRGADPLMAFRYLVTAWGTEVRDEHLLLGELTRAVMRERMIAAEHLSEPLRRLRPYPELAIGSSGGRTLADLWSAFDGQLRPGIDLVVIMPIDAHAEIEAGPEVELVRFDGVEAPPRVHHGLVDQAEQPPASDAVGEVEVRVVETVRPGGATRTQAALRFDPGMAGVRVTSPRGSGVITKDGTCIVSAHAGDTITVHAAEPFDLEVPVRND